jgi:hypothetical protein
MSKYLLPELNALAAEIHSRNIRIGFYDNPRPFDGMLMNVVTEVSEAQEEWRDGRQMTEYHWTVKPGHAEDGLVDGLFRTIDGVLHVSNYDYDYTSDASVPKWLPVTPELIRQMPGIVRYLKPEGIPSELADIIIRVLDICGYHKIDIAAAIADKMAFNDTRDYRHGGKQS